MPRTSRATVVQPANSETISTIWYSEMAGDWAMLAGTPSLVRSTAARMISSGRIGSAIMASVKRISAASAAPPA